MKTRFSTVLLLSALILFIVLGHTEISQAASGQQTGLRLPFDAGLSRHVTGTHDRSSGRHAIDWNSNFENVRAMKSGTIVRTAFEAGYGGKMLFMDNGDGYCTAYLHLDGYYITQGFVERGTVIAKSGNSGNGVTHLHVASYVKHNATCGYSHAYEVAMIFDEVGHELNFNESATSQNTDSAPVQFQNGRSTLWFDQNGERINLEVCADNLAGKTVYARLWRNDRWWFIPGTADSNCYTFWNMDEEGPVLMDRPYWAWAGLGATPDTNWPVHCYGASNGYGLCTQAQYPGDDSDPHSQNSCDGGEGVYLYEHTNYQGKCEKFTADSTNATGWYVGNDTVSSLQIIGSYNATLYQHTDYQGIASLFDGNDADLSDDWIGSDQTSSIRVEQISQFVYSTFKARHSGRCMDVYGGSVDAGTKIIQWDCHNGENQAWQLLPFGNDYYELVVERSGMCLDVSGASQSAGAQLIQWQCHGGDNQLFKKEAVGSYYRLVAKHSNMCVDVYGGQPDNGARLIQWPCHGGDNQQWAIAAQPAPLIEPIGEVTETILPVPSTNDSIQIEHVIQDGETLEMVAGYYDTNTEAILAANPNLSDAEQIYPGMVLYVPARLPEQTEPEQNIIFLPMITR